MSTATILNPIEPTTNFLIRCGIRRFGRVDVRYLFDARRELDEEDIYGTSKRLEQATEFWGFGDAEHYYKLASLDGLAPEYVPVIYYLGTRPC